MPSRLLRGAALVEFVSLGLLLVNLATVHWAAVASLLGPTHGCAYLFVIGATIRESRASSTRLLAIVPGVGGLLVIRRLRASWVAEPGARGQGPAAAVPGPDGGGAGQPGEADDRRIMRQEGER